MRGGSRRGRFGWLEVFHDEELELWSTVDDFDGHRGGLDAHGGYLLELVCSVCYRCYRCWYW